MARKKLSGHQRELLAPITRAMKVSPVFSRLVRKRGRPRGITGRIETRQKHATFDFQWAVEIGEPRLSDLRIAKALRWPDPVRAKKLGLGPCKYRDMSEDTLRRLLAFLRFQTYEPGTPLRLREL